MKYYNNQRAKVLQLLENKSPNSIFRGDPGYGSYRGKIYDFILKDYRNNFYDGICEDAEKYFYQNNISWWGGRTPTTHPLSSQIACLNHLFPIRNDKTAVLNILKSISNDFDDVYSICEADKDTEGYIQFEAVGDEKENYLNEGANSRGANCTSIDALIYAHHKKNGRCVVLVEWKHVENYGNEKKFEEVKKNKETGEIKRNSDGRTAGEVRQYRYYDLIEGSEYLEPGKTKEYSNYEPFYQLMRQTLWAEQMIKHKSDKPAGIEADDYLHLHVIPDENKELLKKHPDKYEISNLGMEDTWKECLTDKDKYIVLSPELLFEKIKNEEKYFRLYEYLRARYW